MRSLQLVATLYALSSTTVEVNGFGKASSPSSSMISGSDYSYRSFNRTKSSSARSAIYELQGGGGSTRVRRSQKNQQQQQRPRTYKVWQAPPPIQWGPVSHVNRDGSAVLAPPMRHPMPRVLPPQPRPQPTPATAVANKPKSSSKSKSSSPLSRVDMSVAMAYFCNAFCVTLPIILTPMIAQGYGLHKTGNPADLTTFVGKVASTAIMGGGFGKIVNGLVCQKLGGVTTASTYLLGLSACSLALSLSTSLNVSQWLVAGMEFFSSAMWVASSVVLSNHHAGDAMKFARGVTFLSLASTAAQLLAKTGGAAMLKVMDWRQVAQAGAILAFVGSLVVQMVVARDVVAVKPATRKQQQQQQIRGGNNNNDPDQQISIPAVIRKAKSVVTSKLFWTIGIAHVSGFLAKTSDRMMGPFLRDVTGLPYGLCGGLTASVTFGFAYGVMKAQKFFELPTVNCKNRKLKGWYVKAVAALAGLSIVGSEAARAVMNPHLAAATIVLCSGIFSSSVAFQFFQIPGMVSTIAFSANKAICLSFLEGLAFFMTAPVWAMSSRIVAKLGWSASWAFVTVAFGLGAGLMMNTLQPILTQQHDNAAAASKSG